MYIDAIEDRKRGVIRVVERKNGKRVFAEYPADYSFYVPDAKGNARATTGERLRKIVPSSYTDFLKHKNSYGKGKTFESDVNYTFRTLEKHYKNTTPPEPHVAFFDIEVGFDKRWGYSTPMEAANPITSIAIYMQWLDRMICLAVPPPTITMDEAVEIADKVGDTLIVQTEAELLKLFLISIEDADILTGWNSDAYDIPYIVNRITQVLDKNEARKCCLWDMLPKHKQSHRSTGSFETYMLYGRVHLDYFALYKKYTYEERASYSLDYIGKTELNESKVPYDGNLDQLYHNHFQKFLEYNIQDTMLLFKMDQKLKYIDLIVTIAHSNNVLLDTAMGTVAMVEQAIAAEAHLRGMILPDVERKTKNDIELVSDKAAGGWVSYRNPGLHKWIGSSDLNSLYPSVIRAFNMSTETLVGQVTTRYTDDEVNDYVANGGHKATFARWWNDRFSTLEMECYFNDDIANKLELTFESGETKTVTGAELKELIFKKGGDWCITANGTIFRNDIEGVIPSLLTRWYKERQELQSVKKQVGKIIDGAVVYDGEDIDNDTEIAKIDVYDFRMDDYISAKETDSRDIMVKFCQEWGLTINNGVVSPNKKSLDVWKRAYGYWDKQQLVKKINLNSAYGGILNKHMKFFDKRIGQSTTLTGRCITKHMTAKTNEFLCGEYNHDGECIIYNDTDSTYFSAWPEVKEDVEAGNFEWNKDIVVKLYDQIGDEVSKTFPEYLKNTFNVPYSRGQIIKSAREIVAETGLFIKKKRYACLVYDKEGSRKDINGSRGEIKAMGLDLRRSDTPAFVQKFLSDILRELLEEKPEEEIIQKIKDFRTYCRGLKPWEKGTPSAVNKLNHYIYLENEYLEARASGRTASTPRIPWQVAASRNWNMLRASYHDQHTMEILDGQKVVICVLKPNPNNMQTIAYPIDEVHLPDWFLELPFDEDAMMAKILDKKLKNLLGVLKWDIVTKPQMNAQFADSFSALFSTE
jgi:DNA polymerase elongation subunit (family B)